VRRIATIAVISVTAAACGGSGHAALYASGPSRACLAGKGLRVGPVSSSSDFIASTATGGAFRVTLARNRVTVSFGQTLEDADNINQAYLGVHAPNVGIADVLRQQQNAVMLWHLHPSDADAATITGCLRS
jgi:hypothetical protein